MIYLPRTILASGNGHIEVINLLLEHKADGAITAQNNEALKSSARNGHLEVVKLLLENKAELKTENYDAFGEASRSGHIEIVKLFLEIGIESKETIECALAAGSIEVARLLLEKETVDIAAAIRKASEYGFYDRIKFLEEYRS